MPSYDLPYRTGLPAILAVCKTIVRLAAKFRPLWVERLQPGDVQALDALLECAEAAVLAIENIRRNS